MLLRDGCTHRTGTLRILELSRLALAERQAVRVAGVWSEHVEAPRLREAVIRREGRRLEQSFYFFAFGRSRLEPFDGPSGPNGFSYLHAA